MDGAGVCRWTLLSTLWNIKPTPKIQGGVRQRHYVSLLHHILFSLNIFHHTTGTPSLWSTNLWTDKNHSSIWYNCGRTCCFSEALCCSMYRHQSSHKWVRILINMSLCDWRNVQMTSSSSLSLKGSWPSYLEGSMLENYMSSFTSSPPLLPHSFFPRRVHSPHLLVLHVVNRNRRDGPTETRSLR